MRYYLEETGLSSVECDYMIDNCRTILLEQLACNHPPQEVVVVEEEEQQQLQQ